MTTKKLISVLRSLDCDECPNKVKCHNMITTGPCMLFEQAADCLEELSSTLEAVKVDRRSCWAEFKAMNDEFETVKAERDAAIQELRYNSNCYHCKRNSKCHAVPIEEPSIACGLYEWRGVKPNGSKQQAEGRTF